MWAELWENNGGCWSVHQACPRTQGVVGREDVQTQRGLRLQLQERAGDRGLQHGNTTTVNTRPERSMNTLTILSSCPVPSSASMESRWTKEPPWCYSQRSALRATGEGGRWAWRGKHRMPSTLLLQFLSDAPKPSP